MGRIVSLIRYRFFIFAGMLPYLLGQAAAFNPHNSLDWHKFWLGFWGILFVLCGVELFNEYFDAKEGGDRIFSQEGVRIYPYYYWLGILFFVIALFIGLVLARSSGPLIILFSFLGFLAAYFYVGPPLKWAYRGLGEIAIAFSYGPLMLLGSYYLQRETIDIGVFFLSLICSLAIFCLALINEIPDYYQDRLVGKRNLVVKMGKQKAIKLLILSLSCVFFLLALGIIFKKVPRASIITFLSLPWVFKSLVAIKKNYDDPKLFLPAINANIAVYFLANFSLAFGYLYF